MYKKEEGYFSSKADGLEISVLAVLPEKEPYEGVVQLVHGMSEHKERYLPFMEYLAEHGYVSVIHDHRGHGKSVGSQEDLGYMYGAGSEGLLKDIETINEELHRRFPTLPLILFGHSMGSLAVRAYTRTHDSTIDMLIVCGSPSKNPGRLPGKIIANLGYRIKGPRSKGRLLEKLSFGAFDKKFAGETDGSTWLCSDPAVCQAYEESALCGFTFSHDAYWALFGLMKDAYDEKHWHCTRPDLPILFVSGEDDPCLINVRKFAEAVQNMRHAGYVDVKGKLYPGMRHEILNEKNKEQVFHDILIYIQKKLGTSSEKEEKKE